MIRQLFLLLFLPESGKLLFSAFLPSPLGRVAERSEVGRGSLPHCISFVFSQKGTQKTSSVSPSGCHLPQRGRQGAAHTITSNNNFPYRLRVIMIACPRGSGAGMLYWPHSALWAAMVVRVSPSWGRIAPSNPTSSPLRLPSRTLARAVMDALSSQAFAALTSRSFYASAPRN